MSPKELNYIQDALSHEKLMKSECQNVTQNIQDNELKAYVQQLEQKHQQIFDGFYRLV